MGTIVDILMGDTNTLDRKELENFNYENTELNPNATQTITTAKIESKSELHNVIDAIKSGYILIVDVSRPPRHLGKDEVIGKLNNAVDSVDGDITWKDREKSELIISPRGVEISRESL